MSGANSSTWKDSYVEKGKISSRKINAGKDSKKAHLYHLPVVSNFFHFIAFFLVAFRDQVFVPYNNIKENSGLFNFPYAFLSQLPITPDTSQTAYASMRARRI